MYLHYCRALCFDGDPDYNNIRQLFRRLFLEKGYEYDWEFDWCKKPNKESVAQENGNKVGEDKKESLEAQDKENGSNTEKHDGISKEIDEESNNISKADTDQSEISPIDNAGLKQVNEGKHIKKLKPKWRHPVRMPVPMTIMSTPMNRKAEMTCKEEKKTLRRSARLKEKAIGMA